ncbi:ABC transporter permease [Psychromonas sp. L1A2]|uniref:ABC transporter permease n=1 Tax=Psychromonas sp. L1A2 TaxID=2686356 RepID=UPI00135BC3DF|nr:FtsX-like permease family protein [Psychromonas sp. L1A2]
MAILSLAFKSLLNRKLTFFITLFSIAISVTLLLGVQTLKTETNNSFMKSISGTDLIIGSRGASSQLLLSSVFHIGNTTNTIKYDTYQKISQSPAVEWAVPISLGDSHHGYTVMATDLSFFDYFSYANKQHLKVESGKIDDDMFAVVIGSEVAKKLNYKIGDEVIVTHGGGEIEGHHHDNIPYFISAILSPSFTAIDQSLIISLEAMEAMHTDNHGHFGVLPGETTLAANHTDHDEHDHEDADHEQHHDEATHDEHEHEDADHEQHHDEAAHDEHEHEDADHEQHHDEAAHDEHDHEDADHEQHQDEAAHDEHDHEDANHEEHHDEAAHDEHDHEDAEHEQHHDEAAHDEHDHEDANHEQHHNEATHDEHEHKDENHEQHHDEAAHDEHDHEDENHEQHHDEAAHDEHDHEDENHKQHHDEAAHDEHDHEATHEGHRETQDQRVARLLKVKPEKINAIFVGLTSPQAVLGMQSYVNNFQEEPLSAIIPALALQELWEFFSLAEVALSIVTVFVVLVGLLGMLSIILMSLNERRREMAILRSVGARPGHIFSLIIGEAGFVCFAGILLGIALLYLLLLILQSPLASYYGFYLDINMLTSNDLLILAIIQISALLIALIPGWLIYKYSLSDGMSIKF